MTTRGGGTTVKDPQSPGTGGATGGTMGGGRERMFPSFTYSTSGKSGASERKETKASASERGSPA